MHQQAASNKELRPQLQPLRTEGRTREPHVELQVREMLDCRPDEFWARVRIREHTSHGWVSEEALVSLLRIRLRCGDNDEAWSLVEILVERSARYIDRNVRCWKCLSNSQVEECIRDVQMQMVEDLIRDTRSLEFWEVRFYLCLKRRLLNCVQKYRATAEAEMQLLPLTDSDGHETDAFDNIPAPADVGVQTRLEAAEALSLLTDQERMAFTLWHYERWSQQRIAEHLGVTDRTVRNLLSRAEKRLQAWRNGES